MVDPDITAASATGPSAFGPVVAGERGYRILSELGRGGFGTVYLAERADGEFRQRVAIKRLGSTLLASSEAVARFRQEREILARLEHPGIARLLDGGQLPDGAPFLVMEYVEGERIDRWSDARGLGVAARVELLLEVCAAVEAAHQRLIVHRDLKPGNILVGADGAPKLLDFGIAKLLDPAAADWTVAETRLGATPLTLRYASPEQLRGEPIGTTSDVYSLGVVLYELLAGRSPYAGRDESYPALSRAICDLEPLPPSAASALAARDLTAPGWVAPAPARDRPTSGRRAELAGDLDAIVLKALRKSVAERYPSVAALAGDLRRYLEGLPVEARRGSRLYRWGKFARRNRLPIAAALLVGALAAGWAASLAVQLERTRTERDKARQTARFLTELFEISDPDASRGKEVTARSILDAGAARIERELAGQPAVRAGLMTTIGKVYHELGLHEPAERQLERAVTLLRADAAIDPATLAAGLEALGTLRLDQARFAEAVALQREALALRQREHGRRSEEVARLLNNLGTLEWERDDFATAEPLLVEALEIRRELHGAEGAELAETLNNLGLLYQEQGKLEAAEPLLRESLEIRRARDAGPGRIARALGNLALLLDDKGDYAAAEPLYRESLAMEIEVYGPEHPVVANTLNNLASIRYRAGDYADAEALLRRSFELQVESLGAEHPQVAITRGNLSFMLAAQGRFAEAEPLLRETLRVHRDVLGDRSATLAITLRNLGTLLFDRGDASGADAALADALAVATAAVPAESPLLAGIRARRATLAYFDGEAATALAEFESALAALDRSLPAAHPDRVDPLVGAADAAVALGRLDVAEARARSAVDLARRVLPAASWQVAQAEGTLGAVLAARGRASEARPLLERCLETVSRRFGAGHPRTELARRRLAALSPGAAAR
jgi:serine/threonine-protein kinase